MKTSSSKISVGTLANRVRKEKISLKHRLQRKEGAWKGNERKTLLIDSLLRDIPVPAIYTVIEGGKQSVIDGVQRLSTFRDFTDDAFKMPRTAKPVVLDGTTYEIAGKTFSKLDSALQDKISDAQVLIYEVSDFTDDEVREMFRRLNFGKPLNTIQQMTPFFSDKTGDIIFNIMEHPLMERQLTPDQIISSVDMDTALQVLMLAEKTGEYDFGSFRKGDKQKFIIHYNEILDDEQTGKTATSKVDTILKAMDKLNETLEEDEKLKPGTLPFAIYGMYKAYKDQKSSAKYVEWLKQFIKDYPTNEAYLQYCGSGTASAANVKGRYEYFRKAVNTL